MIPPAHPLAAAYRTLLEQLDAWFVAATVRHPGVIPCRAGCTACCHGPFDITVADALLLREAVAGLAPADREAVRRSAERQVAAMQLLEPGWDRPWDVGALGEERFDRLTAALAAEPCPLLDERGGGTCRVYASRPLVCRLIGLGLITPEGRLLENACPIQAEFPAYQALDPMPFALETLEDEEGEFLRAAAIELLGSPGRADYETTIAAAIHGFARPEG